MHWLLLSASGVLALLVVVRGQGSFGNDFHDAFFLAGTVHVNDSRSVDENKCFNVRSFGYFYIDFLPHGRHPFLSVRLSADSPCA